MRVHEFGYYTLHFVFVIGTFGEIFGPYYISRSISSSSSSNFEAYPSISLVLTSTQAQSVTSLAKIYVGTLGHIEFTPYNRACLRGNQSESSMGHLIFQVINSTFLRFLGRFSIYTFLKCFHEKLRFLLAMRLQSTFFT